MLVVCVGEVTVAVCVEVAVDVELAVGVDVVVLVAIAVSVLTGVWVPVAVLVVVAVAAIDVPVGWFVGVVVPVDVLLAPGVKVAVRVDVAVLVDVVLAVAVPVAVFVRVGVAVGVLAGVPVRDADHAANAVGLAIKMRDYMLYRKSQLGEATFQMRIGVHSGSVVAGIVGSKKFAYDIWGDTVNMAARMEQNSIAGKINISQSTYELVKNRFHCEYRGEIEAKNKGRVAMYYVLDEL